MQMTYVPILKAKAGELKALTQLDPWDHFELHHVRPLVEVISSEDLLADDRDEQQFEAWLNKTVKSLVQAWPSSRPEPLMLDTSYAERDPAGRVADTPALVALLRNLHQQEIPVIPVVHLSDTDEHVNHVRVAIQQLGLRGGACIRLTSEDLDDAVAPLNVVATSLAQQLSLTPSDIDLVLDFGAISTDDSLAVTSRLARFVLPLLATVPWRRLVLAAGAFPINLSEVSAFTFGSIPRLDRDLWMRLSTMGLGRPLDFGDYAVTHPTLQVGVAFAAPPQLRYTAPDSWLVIKGRRADRRGHAQFYDLCRELTSQYKTVVAPPSSSWGDQYIHDAAHGVAKGPGNATTWRAIATSQHIERVARNISERAEP